MYRHFYNLTARPFELSPDPKFIWLGEKHKEGLAAVRYGILANAGFLSLTGDVGTGKTTLVNALAKSLGDNIIFAKIPDPYLETLDFFNFTASAFEMNKKFSTKGEFLGHFKEFLHNAHSAHKKVLLIIEEAQRLGQALLEEVRLLSNIEKQNKKLISILLVGQNEFNDELKKNRALKQRVNISYQIQPLTEIETKEYIRHRLKIAGSKTGIFSQGAIHEVYAFSRGNPRLINVICDLALLSGYLKETKIIDAQIIKDGATEFEKSDQKEEDIIEGEISLAKPIQETGQIAEPAAIVPIHPQVTQKSSSKPGRRRAAYLAVILLLICLITFGYFYYFNLNQPSVANFKPILQQSLGWFTVTQPETTSANTQIDKATTAGSQIRMLPENRNHGPTPVLKPDNQAIQQEEITLLQNQLLDLKAQKTSAETQLTQLKTRNEALITETGKLKSHQKRLLALETDVKQRDQTLSHLEDRLKDLENALNQEKNTKDKLTAELSAKTAQVADLQQKFDTTQANYVKLESEIAKSKEQTAQLQRQLSDLSVQKTSADNELSQLKARNVKLEVGLVRNRPEINQLKGQLSDLEAPKTSVQKPPVILEVQEELSAENDTSKKEAKSANPDAIIDWVLKKKSE